MEVEDEINCKKKLSNKFASKDAETLILDVRTQFHINSISVSLILDLG